MHVVCLLVLDDEMEIIACIHAQYCTLIYMQLYALNLGEIH